MSVRELNGKFKGLRVQRIVSGVPMMQHFSFRLPQVIGGVTTRRDATKQERAALHVQAVALDAEYEVLQRAAATSHTFDPFVSRTNTGIKGIAHRIGKDSQGYAVEGFWLNLSVNGEQHSSSVRLASRSWREGWRLIVQKLVDVKELDEATHKKILAKMPKEKLLRTKT